MNFKKWLLNELTDPELDRLKGWLKNIGAEELLEFKNHFPFIYAAKNDKLYFSKSSIHNFPSSIKNVKYHRDLVRSLSPEDQEMAGPVYNDYIWPGDETGIVGRVGIGNRDIPNDEAVVAFYVKDAFTDDLAKRTVQLLVQNKLITPLSFVISRNNVYLVKDYINIASVDTTDEEKRLGALQIAMHLGAWPDGRRITAAERKYIMKELGMELITRKHAWQKSLEDNKLLTPGHRFYWDKSENNLHFF